jgi:hypothetical protein
MLKAKGLVLLFVFSDVPVSNRQDGHTPIS